MGKSTEPLKTRQYVTAETLTQVYHYCIHDAMLKSLIINTIGVFRVGVFTTLKTVKLLSLSSLQVTPRVSIEGSNRATRLPQRGLNALVLFFHRDSVSASDAPHCLSAHVMQFLKGHVGKSGLFAPVDES